MARADRPYRGGAALAWSLALLVPLSAPAAGDEPVLAKNLPEPGMLEFLGEEPGLDDELEGALLSADLDRELDRVSKRRKVKDDEAKQPQ